MRAPRRHDATSNPGLVLAFMAGGGPRGHLVRCAARDAAPDSSPRAARIGGNASSTRRTAAARDAAATCDPGGHTAAARDVGTWQHAGRGHTAAAGSGHTAAARDAAARRAPAARGVRRAGGGRT